MPAIRTYTVTRTQTIQVTTPDGYRAAQELAVETFNAEPNHPTDQSLTTSIHIDRKP